MSAFEMTFGNGSLDQAGLGTRGGGWLETTLPVAMRYAQFIGLVLVSIVLGTTAMFSELSVAPIAVAVMVLSVVGAGVAVLRFGLAPPILIVCYYGTLVVYYVVAVHPHEPLMGILIPITSWTVILPVMLWRGFWSPVCAVLLATVFASIIRVAHPHWDLSVLTKSITANIVMIVLAVGFIRFLRRLALAVDRHAQRNMRRRLDLISGEALNRASAEFTRVLHDTIVNTLGGLARLPSNEVNRAEVRDRCRQDLTRIEDFQRDRAKKERPPRLDPLDSPGISLRRTGLVGDDLRRFESLVPDTTLHALRGCVSEAILNAAKHSGASEVVCDIAHVEGELRLTVFDRGHGFDPGRVPQRGIAHSILARARDHQIQATIESSPGNGTTVRLHCSLTHQEPEPQTTRFRDATAWGREFAFRFLAGWTAHAILIGALLDITSNRPGSLPVYLLFLLLATLEGLVWVRHRAGRLVMWEAMPLLAAIPLTNWLALRAIDYGTGPSYTFPAVALTILPITIYVVTSARRLFLVAVLFHLLSMLVILPILGDTGNVTPWITVVLQEALVLGLTTVVFAFLENVRSIGTRLARDENDLHRRRRDAADFEAVTEARKQWESLDLRRPLGLLRDIADGRVSPADPMVQQRCAEEEVRLRQISSLPPGPSLMAWWFFLALAEAHNRSVALTIAAENTQMHDPEQAEAFGRLLLDCVKKTTTGSELKVTFVPYADLPRMLIVIVDRARDDTPRPGPKSSRLVVHIERLPGHTFVEASADGESPDDRKWTHV